MVQIIFLVLGLAVGSFINVVVARASLLKAILPGRSHCPNCHRKLKVKDLVPLVSFFWLKGRCRYCKKRISWQYPLVELISGLGFLLVTILGLNLGLVIWLAVFFSLALLLSVYDIKYLIIPNSFLWLLLAWILVGHIFFLHDTIEVGINVLSALSLGAFFLALWLVSSGRWIGGGDVKLAFLVGFLVGWPGTLVLFLLAFGSGALVAVVLLAFKKVTMHSQIPFGPYLAAASFVSLLWSEEIIKWYLALF